MKNHNIVDVHTGHAQGNIDKTGNNLTTKPGSFSPAVGESPAADETDQNGRIDCDRYNYNNNHNNNNKSNSNRGLVAAEKEVVGAEHGLVQAARREDVEAWLNSLNLPASYVYMCVCVCVCVCIFLCRLRVRRMSRPG